MTTERTRRTSPIRRCCVAARPRARPAIWPAWASTRAVSVSVTRLRPRRANPRRRSRPTRTAVPRWCRSTRASGSRCAKSPCPRAAPVDEPPALGSQIAPAPAPPTTRQAGRLLSTVARGFATPDAAVSAQSERELIDSVRQRQSDRRVVAFMTGKGGVGCTTVAVGRRHHLHRAAGGPLGRHRRAAGDTVARRVVRRGPPTVGLLDALGGRGECAAGHRRWAGSSRRCRVGPVVRPSRDRRGARPTRRGAHLPPPRRRRRRRRRRVTRLWRGPTRWSSSADPDGSGSPRPTRHSGGSRGSTR